MLYALSKPLIQHLRLSAFRPELTGAEMLMAAYRTDPAVIARILPKPLRPAPEPIAFAFVARYPQTNFGCTYSEGALFVEASFRGRIGGYCLAMPVDDDTALIAGREHHGFPKKLADRISLERAGETRIGSVVRKGVEILRIELEPSAPADATTLAGAGATFDGPGTGAALKSYLFKYFPSTSGKGFDYLPRLVQQTTIFRPRPGLRGGEPRVRVASSARDPLGDVPVIGAPILGLYGVWDNTMLPGRVVARVWNPWRFLPYAFFRSDAMLAALEDAERQAVARPEPSLTTHEESGRAQ